MVNGHLQESACKRTLFRQEMAIDTEDFEFAKKSEQVTHWQPNCHRQSVFMQLDGDYAPHTRILRITDAVGSLRSQQSAWRFERREFQMGRKDARLTKRLTIRMDDDLYEKICYGAKAARLSQVEYTRCLLRKGKVTVKQEIIAEVPELKRLIAEFGKIGSNLNQIAHHFNAGGAHSSYMYQETQKALSALYAMKYEVEAMGGEFRGYSEARLHKKR